MDENFLIDQFTKRLIRFDEEYHEMPSFFPQPNLPAYMNQIPFGFCGEDFWNVHSRGMIVVVGCGCVTAGPSNFTYHELYGYPIILYQPLQSCTQGRGVI